MEAAPSCAGRKTGGNSKAPDDGHQEWLMGLGQQPQGFLITTLGGVAGMRSAGLLTA
jgi:hypothetical protein